MSKHEEISVGLIADILSERYRVGERLPSERDLAARFDANRGSVREAMKKLEQIGLADVQPGGARVRDKEDASLDVIGHLLSQGELPDIHLVDQILVVMSGLVAIAASQVASQGSQETIAELRALVKPLKSNRLTKESHTLARLELISKLVQASGNLPLQLIGRALFEQMTPIFSALARYVKVDPATFVDIADQLDQALETRKIDSVTSAFSKLYETDRENMMSAFEEARSQLEKDNSKATIK